MKLRIARHSADLEAIAFFYRNIVGLDVLGSFENHDHYDGIFLGFAHEHWELEFTSSPKKPAHTADEDDALVFYLNSTIELNEIIKKILTAKIPCIKPANPYWQQHGYLVHDPDNFPVIFTLAPSLPLNNEDSLTSLANTKNIVDWDALLRSVQKLPYGRNQNRQDLSLVLKEQQGTCSSKHALVKAIADRNKIPSVKLMLGMYKMNSDNTGKIGSILTEKRLAHIPEAHCYLKINNLRIDLTSERSDMNKISMDLLEEIEIQPEDVNQFKIDYHQRFLKQWIEREQIPYSFEEIWKIREDCILALSQREDSNT